MRSVTSRWGRHWGRTAVSGHLGSSRTCDDHHDHQSSVFGMDAGLQQCPSLQGTPGSRHRSCPHLGNGNGVLPIPSHARETAESENRRSNRQKGSDLCVVLSADRRLWGILARNVFHNYWLETQRKKKEPKKRKAGGLWKLAPLWKKANAALLFPTAAWIKPSGKPARFYPQFHTGPVTINNIRRKGRRTGGPAALRYGSR